MLKGNEDWRISGTLEANKVAVLAENQVFHHLADSDLHTEYFNRLKVEPVNGGKVIQPLFDPSLIRVQ